VEDSTKSPLVLEGSVDAYFRSNVSGGFDTAPGTSFANLPGFSLGMVNLIASKEGEKTGFVADLVIGPRGADAVFASEAPLNLVNQLYAYWNINDKVTATLGNFNTFLGYEVISPTANFNYSTSYMFSYGPFSHAGLKLDFDLGSGFSLMAGVFNPTDFTDFNPLNEYVGGAQLGYDFGKGSVYVNTLFDDDFFQIDLTGGVDLTDKVYLGINATSASDNFYGVAGYLQVSTSEALSFGTRVEYFADEGVGVLGTGENVLDATLSANYKVGDLTIIPEFRVDLVSNDVFDDGEGIMEDQLASFVLAVVYGF
ncbi:MAG: outer membrane beta-barrel protein, partial [Bacteroidota bacterium]